MAAVENKESKTVTQTVSVTSTPTTSQPIASINNAGHQLVHIVSTTDQLNELLNDKNKVVLIEFFAEWCGPCKVIAQKLETWAKIYDVTIAKVDVDDLEEVAIEYNVAGIPTFTFIKEKQVLDQIEGSAEEKIIAALDKYCKSTDAAPKRTSTTETHSKKKVSPRPNAVLPVKADESEKN